MSVSLLIAIAVGYLLGALPFGYLVARAKGVNIFEVGSKNPGATNVRRVLGAVEKISFTEWTRPGMALSGQTV